MEEAVAKLTHLRDDIWVGREFRHQRRGILEISWSERRRLTREEWDEVIALIVRFTLPVTMENSAFGFNAAMGVWGPEPPALYPGVELDPEAIVRITAHHLPLELSTGNPTHVAFEDAWNTFVVLTHSDANRDMLRRSNPPPPGDKAKFVY